MTRAVSAVAANSEVRRELRRRQREWAAAHGGGVIEGRDIGSVVFPGAELKVYLTASDAERAGRRSKEVLDMDYDAIAADIAVGPRRLESLGGPSGGCRRRHHGGHHRAID